MQKEGSGRCGGGQGKGGPSEADSIDPVPYLKLLQRIDSEVGGGARRGAGGGGARSPDTPGFSGQAS